MDEIVKKDEQGLAPFDAELAQYAKDAAASENQAGKNFLKFRGGLFANKTPINVKVVNVPNGPRNQLVVDGFAYAR